MYFLKKVELLLFVLGCLTFNKSDMEINVRFKTTFLMKTFHLIVDFEFYIGKWLKYIL